MNFCKISEFGSINSIRKEMIGAFDRELMIIVLQVCDNSLLFVVKYYLGIIHGLEER